MEDSWYNNSDNEDYPDEIDYSDNDSEEGNDYFDADDYGIENCTFTGTVKECNAHKSNYVNGKCLCENSDTEADTKNSDSENSDSENSDSENSDSENSDSENSDSDSEEYPRVQTQ